MGAIGKQQPNVDRAKAQSDALRSAAEALRRKLIDTAARVQALESEKVTIASDVAALTAQEGVLSAAFAKDRAPVAQLLALMENLQSDMPPAMVLKPDDALGAARGAMLVGASLPKVYGAAAALALRIRALKATRANLLAKKAEASANAAKLGEARSELNQLLAIREAQFKTADATYSSVKKQLDETSARAADLKTLLERVVALRQRPAAGDLIVVTAERDTSSLSHRSLEMPVVGTPEPPGLGDVAGPGLTFVTGPGAQVIAPMDAQVLFSGPYHKYGHVLILKMRGGYDAVLAGLGRVDVRPEDQVLAGEPVGTMPSTGATARLYFELRQNGRGIDPAPFLTLDLRKAKKT